MYFADELGIHPAELLRYAPLDQFLQRNAIPVQNWESVLVDKAQLHVTAIRSLVALVASFLLGVVHRGVPTATGLGLLYYAYGNQVVLIFVFCALVYALLLMWPRRAGTASWFLTLPLLVVCMERSMDRWATGEVDISGALMVAVLKLIAICYNRQDGARQQAREAVNQDDSAMLILAAPAPLHFASYILASGNVLAGPFNEYSDYMAFTARRGQWAAAFLPGLWRPALSAGAYCVLSGVGMLALWTYLNGRFSHFDLTGPGVWAMPFALRIAYGLLNAMIGRLKFYTVWTFSESGLNASGFGFNGFADAEKRVPKFDRYVNSVIWQVETCTSMAQVPKYWNVNTGVFLRRYCYSRLGGGFVALAATQIICSIWHGPCEGYLAFFGGSIVMLHSSKVIYRQEKRLPAALVNSVPWKLLKWFFGHSQLSTLGNAFFTLKWSQFSTFWGSLYWSPLILGAAVCLLGAVVPTPRGAKRSAANGQAAQLDEAAAKSDHAKAA